jgi:hypothetical protein
MLRCAAIVSAICVLAFSAAADTGVAALAAPGDCAQPSADYETPPLYEQPAGVSGSAAEHFAPSATKDVLELLPTDLTRTRAGARFVGTASALVGAVDSAAGTAVGGVSGAVEGVSGAAGGLVEGIGAELTGVAGGAGDAIGMGGLGAAGGSGSGNGAFDSGGGLIDTARGILGGRK